MGFLHRFYRNHVLWRFFTIGCCFSIFACASDTIKVGDSIKDGASIVSAGQKFVLGFFGPQDSNSRYVGIWYYNDFNSANKSVVWVANRRTPISGIGGILTVAKDGGLVLKNVDGKMAWSSNVTALSKYSAAVLTDTGNLVLQDKEKVLWQSFDDPTDTCLSQMHVRFDLHGEERRFFTSWRTDTDPSPGNYAMGIDPRGSPQIVIWEGANRRWRSGYWNGIMFIGIPDVKVRYQTGFRLISENYTRVYFVYFPYDRSVLVKFRLSPNGVGLDEEWNEEQKGWRVGVAHPVDECDLYGHCGPFGICNDDKESTCRCLPGFVPYDSGLWSRRNWTGGCIRRTELQCEKGGRETDGFMRIKHVNLPDYVDYVGSENAAGCKKKCLQNCSCTAYAFVVGINCMIWTGDLVDVQQFVEGGKTIHIRLAQSELGSKSSNIFKIASLTLVLVVATLLAVVSMWLYVKRGRNSQGEGERPGNALGIEEQPETGTDLTVFNLKDVSAATDNFAEESKLGRGGFGQVYKGTLPGGQEIAVKRLSRKSSQGSEEFKNEITLIAKLQHRNLVKLLGCCIQREERMLLYEYMPNKSLDFYIFDAERRAQLDWSKRFNIIEGIARGLLYLHRDSRLRIIHRDLKASNILLDEDMNPKISDFGMARIFGRNQNEASTMRVVGTYGYMAPEYAMEGLFSLKSDVYSFGVLLLEIITGQRNNSFRSDEYSNIIGYAWDLWESGRALELLDSWISEKCCHEEEEQVARCVQLGMLCVQDMAADRPNMQSVVMVLECEIVTLPMPKQPTFTSMRHAEGDDMSTHTADVCAKDVSITEVTGR